MLNIVIPMAGKGSRFVDAGYKDPKPFIDVCGLPMIQWVVDNLAPYEPYKFIFIARKEHKEYIKKYMSFATEIIYVDKITEGAACTVLLAEKYINNDDSLLIANSDQLVVWNKRNRVVDLVGQYGTVWIRETSSIQDMINWAIITTSDAMIATFNSTHPKWSYARVDESSGLVDFVAEKKVISNNATVGIYWYKHGKYFVNAANNMIKKNIRVNGEFYVCPVFNEMTDKQIRIYPVSEMFGLGTPEDLEYYRKFVMKTI